MHQLTLLTHLRLAHNRLTGTLPDLSKCSFLSTLDVAYNRLSGPISFNTLCPTRLSPPFRPPTSNAAALAMQARVSSVVELHLQHNHLSQIILPSTTELRFERRCQRKIVRCKIGGNFRVFSCARVLRLFLELNSDISSHSTLSPIIHPLKPSARPSGA